ncbi:MAG: right-handed parallel beta-helix repeat-containing protein [Alphaproteobacteria bacterium]
MSIGKPRTKSAQRFGISPGKLLATSALTAAGLLALSASPAHAGDGPVGEYDVIILDNRAPVEESLGYNRYQDNTSIIGNAIQEDVGIHGHSAFDSPLTVITGIEKGQAKWFGKVSATGDLFFYDVNGILFGSSSQVDVVGNSAFIGGSYSAISVTDSAVHFDANIADDASIIIEKGAMINVGDAGLAAFVAPHISNNGVINAKMGKVVLAAGETVTLDLYGDGLVEVAVDGELADALIENSGTINAEGGHVQMTALAAKGAVDNIINMDGVITVASATQKGGKIILSGGDHGTVKVSGKLDASGTTGGDISVTGENVEIAAPAELKADGGDGDIRMIGQKNLAYHGAASAEGGFIETSAPHVIIDGTFKVGSGGEVLIDPADLCVFGAGGVCGGLSSVDFLTSIRPVLLGGGTVTTINGPGTDDGDIVVVGDLSSGGFVSAARGTWNVNATDDTFFGTNGSQGIGAGAQTANLVVGGAGLDLNLRSLNGGAGGLEFAYVWIEDGSTINTGGGNATITAGNFSIDAGASLNAGAGTVTFNLVDTGTIGLGVGAGNMRITQAELERIDAAALTVGGSNTSVINVEGVDTTSATIADLVTLNTNNITGPDDHVNFAGVNVFNALTVNSDDNIVLADGASIVTKIGDATFNGDTNNGSVGDMIMGVGSEIASNGNNVVINALALQMKSLSSIGTEGGNVNITTSNVWGDGSVTLEGGAFIDTTNDANDVGGDIVIENGGIFSSADANSLRTLAGGKISVHQWAGGSLQNAIDAMDNQGNGQNNLFAHAGTYAENLTINQANLKLTGLEEGVIPGPDVIISGNGTDPVISVEVSNFNLDPVVVDGNGAAYGLVAVDAGANGLVVDGNIFRDTTSAGIKVSNTTGGISTIKNNDFEADSTRGVEIAGLSGGSTVNITGNTIGSDGQVVNGVLATGAIEDGAAVNVIANTIAASNDGIRVDGEVMDSMVEISGNNITAGSEGIDFLDKIINSTIHMFSDNGALQTIAANGSGIVFRKSIEDSEIVAAGYDITATGGDGIRFEDEIDNSHVGLGFYITSLAPNNLTIRAGGSIKASGSGIVFEGPVKKESTVEVSTNFIQGLNGDGIRFEKEVLGSEVRIGANRNISGGDGDGILFEDRVINSNIIIGAYAPPLPTSYTGGGVVELIGNSITGSENGVNFAATVTNSMVNINNNTKIIGETDDGVIFDAVISGSTVNVNGNANITGLDRGVSFENGMAGGSLVSVNGNALIEGQSIDGVLINGATTGSTVNINYNTKIIGNDEGIDIAGINNSKITIYNNAEIIGTTDDGIEFEGAISNGSTVTVLGNGNITGGDDGIEFDGAISNSIVNIIGNNHGIHGTDNGVVFNADISGSAVSLEGNIIDGGVNGVKMQNIDLSGGTVVNVNANKYIAGGTGDGVIIHDSVHGGALVSVSGNLDITGGDNGVDLENIPGAVVYNNYVHDTGSDAIKLVNGRDSFVLGNKIEAAGRDGIHAENSARILIDSNKILGRPVLIGPDLAGAARDGIHVITSTDAVINNNDILGGSGFIIGTAAGANRDGIHVEDSAGVDVTNNRVRGKDSVFITPGATGAHGNGIFVGNSAGALIQGNDIFRVGQNGIYLSGSNNSVINSNTISRTGWHGIKVNPSDNVQIANNGITGAGIDGIHVDGGKKADIWSNYIGYVGDDGIDVNNNDYVDIWGNYIHNTGKYYSDGNGIEVSDSYRADMNWNTIHNAGDDGIEVDDSHKADIKYNTIYNIYDDGIDVDDSNHTDIKYNTVYNTYGDGIQVRDSNHADIKWNLIRHAYDDGIDYENGYGSRIWGNNIRYVKHNGIEVEDSAFISIKHNDVRFSGGAGIFVDPSWFIDVTGNVVKNNTSGIYFDDVYFSEIKHNIVQDNVIGIKLRDSHFIDVNKNLIADNYVGLWAYGGGNGYIKVRNNIFLDNPYHAKFNSGIIDLTHLDEGAQYSNEFYGGKVALYFDAWKNKPWLLSLVKDGGVANGWTYDYLGFTPWVGWGDFVANTSYTFDTFDGTSVFPPNEFGGTIGTQLFNGQSDYFVKLGSKTFVVPGDAGEGEPEVEAFAVSRYDDRKYFEYPDSWKAIWLDARDSTYVQNDVPFRPSDTGGALTESQLSFLTDKFFHWPNVNNRGIFFFGFVPDENQTIDNVEDFFRRFGPFGPGLSGLNLRITGLPSVGPLNVAGIQPFAGDNVADIEPAAGDEGNGVADIEPAAGGDAACWGDVLTAAVNGAVDYNFTSDPAESLNDTVNCGS